MVLRDDSALLPQLRIEMANNLVTAQIEVKPLLAARAFQTSDDLLVESSSFSHVSDLHDYVALSLDRRILNQGLRSRHHLEHASMAMRAYAVPMFERAFLKSSENIHRVYQRPDLRWW